LLWVGWWTFSVKGHRRGNPRAGMPPPLGGWWAFSVKGRREETEELSCHHSWVAGRVAGGALGPVRVMVWQVIAPACYNCHSPPPSTTSPLSQLTGLVLCFGRGGWKII